MPVLDFSTFIKQSQDVVYRQNLMHAGLVSRLGNAKAASATAVTAS